VRAQTQAARAAAAAAAAERAAAVGTGTLVTSPGAPSAAPNPRTVGVSSANGANATFWGFEPLVAVTVAGGGGGQLVRSNARPSSAPQSSSTMVVHGGMPASHLGLVVRGPVLRTRPPTPPPEGLRTTWEYSLDSVFVPRGKRSPPDDKLNRQSFTDARCAHGETCVRASVCLCILVRSCVHGRVLVCVSSFYFFSLSFEW